MPGLDAVFVAFAAVILWQTKELIFSPVCMFCGKRREHARDCPIRQK